jgi:hypothetical protein
MIKRVEEDVAVWEKLVKPGDNPFHIRTAAGVVTTASSQEEAFRKAKEYAERNGLTLHPHVLK